MKHVLFILSILCASQVSASNDCEEDLPKQATPPEAGKKKKVTFATSTETIVIDGKEIVIHVSTPRPSE